MALDATVPDEEAAPSAKYGIKPERQKRRGRFSPLGRRLWDDEQLQSGGRSRLNPSTFQLKTLRFRLLGSMRLGGESWEAE